jgi:hypothetical protein
VKKQSAIVFKKSSSGNWDFIGNDQFGINSRLWNPIAGKSSGHSTSA